MTDPSELRSVRIVRTFDAPIDLVFRTWVEPAHVARWMKCEPDVELTLDNWAPAPGRTFTTAWSRSASGRR